MDVAVEMAQQALLTAAEVSLPVLAAGLAVGLLFSVLQSITQVHEPTVSFVPRILAMAAAVFFLIPWILGVLGDYAREVLGQLAQGVVSP
jgi:flagellar biosynthetic protein FliQ